MLDPEEIIKDIFAIRQNDDFEILALRIFQYQYNSVDVYREYVDLLNVRPDSVKDIRSIPFLPISLFKKRKVVVSGSGFDLEFHSSGTSAKSERSIHYVKDKVLYQRSLSRAFNMVASNPTEYLIYSILPGYLENPNSSLIYMVKKLSEHSRDKILHEFSDKFDDLSDALKKSKEKGDKVLLFGVSHALIDFAQKYPADLSNTTIIETGGMKGRRKEITRQELHTFIKNRLQPARIISEYGMTELLSQAYTDGDTYFSCPPWMKILIRDTLDPYSISDTGSGVINIIDLANLYSCSFIASDDLGYLKYDGKFEVTGRFDHSDTRGCNLLYLPKD